VFAAHLVFEYVGFVRAVSLSIKLKNLLLTRFKMSGPSMEPTLGDRGEYVVEDRLSYKLRPDSISRGDLVTLRSPLNPFRIVCKRVIGLAGDVICVDPTGAMAPSTEHVIVPKGHVWLSGDNAAMSRDSRQYGPVSTALIQGKLCARVSRPV
jgi:inner membrane protease subunit 1